MRIWQRKPDCGPLAYLFDLIQNLKSGQWIENCPQMIGSGHRRRSGQG